MNVKIIAVAFVLLMAIMGTALGAQNLTVPENHSMTVNLSDEVEQSLSGSTLSIVDNSSSGNSKPKQGSEDVDNQGLLSKGVSKGIELFIRGMMDGAYSGMNANESETEFTNARENGVYSALVDVPNPYENKSIVDLYGGYINLSLYLSALFIIGAIVGRSIERARLSQRHNLTQAAFAGGLALCGLAMISSFIYAGSLEVIKALNGFITMPALPIMTSNPDSLLVHIAQTLCDLVLLVFLTIRYYVIYITAVAVPIIIVLLVPEHTRDFAQDLIEKIIRILALQPAALFVYVVCLLSLDDLPSGLKAFGHLGTTLMIFLTCWYFMFGNFTLLKKGVSFAISKGISFTNGKGVKI
ncbi:MAG: hypothetical protein PHW84_01930 [Methanosarcina sp.]|nr:hypothetical protein [Methanosarcina sp.]